MKGYLSSLSVILQSLVYLMKKVERINRRRAQEKKDNLTVEEFNKGIDLAFDEGDEGLLNEISNS